jgi:hypothetical protein
MRRVLRTKWFVKAASKARICAAVTEPAVTKLLADRALTEIRP